jgi:hypothetical protein
MLQSSDFIITKKDINLSKLIFTSVPNYNKVYEILLEENTFYNLELFNDNIKGIYKYR